MERIKKLLQSDIKYLQNISIIVLVYTIIQVIPVIPVNFTFHNP